MKPTLGKLIQGRRRELDLTQEELAERVGDGVRQSDISRLEHDKVALPRRARLERIASALDLPLGVLLVQSGWMGASANVDPSNGDGEDSQSTDVPDGVSILVNAAEPASIPTLKKAMREVQALVKTAEFALDKAQEKIEDAVDITSVPVAIDESRDDGWSNLPRTFRQAVQAPHDD
jgi:transcriptional regulator with XRE-family HTH domain